MIMKNAFSYLTIIFGILIGLFSAFADALGLGKSGFQAAQIFGVQIGIITILLGVALIIHQKKREGNPVPFWLNLRNGIYNLPALFWVVIGILPAFIPFLVAPMFFNSNLRIYYPERYLPKIIPIGHDFLLLMDAVKTWIENNQTTQFVFTPLVIILFSPLQLLSYPQSYYVIVIATLVSYLILSLIAILISDSRNHSSIAFIAAISIFSYGLQFELERGQSHTIALMLCVWAIYIFHKQPHFRLFAYLLFCISVQLKFYPALFIVLFVDDWRDWKTNLIRFGALGLVNFLAFFLLGFSYFISFYNHLINSVQGSQAGAMNHSISSFGSFLQSSGMGLFDGSALNWIKGHIGLIENMLYIYFLICFLSVLINAYLKNRRGTNLDLLLVCVIGGTILPSISHDYTLPLLTVPFAISLSDWHRRNYPWAKIITIALIIAASFTYSLTLFPLNYKPIYFQNSFPMLFVILTIVTLQNLAQKRRSVDENSE